MRADAVRSAVDQTFQAAAGQANVTRERAQELVDELAHAAGRVRGALDLRPIPAEDIELLRARLADLEQRVAVLERSAAPAKRAAASKRPPVTTKPRAAASKRPGDSSTRAAPPAQRGPTAKPDAAPSRRPRPRRSAGT